MAQGISAVNFNITNRAATGVHHMVLVLRAPPVATVVLQRSPTEKKNSDVVKFTKLLMKITAIFTNY